MKQTNELTALQWLAPSMARDGLIKNGDWVMPAAAEAASLFADSKLHLPAQFLAALHRFAIDYLKQAPVLVLAATYGKDLLRRKDRLEIGQPFLASCRAGARLPALMQSYGLAPQLRALSGKVLRYEHLQTLKALSKLPPSMLAQCIPASVNDQVLWLRAIERWRSMIGARASNADMLFEWAVGNIRDEAARRSAMDIVDYIRRSNLPFDPRWTFARALNASQRWHLELARRPFAAEAERPDWTTVIDYAPLPIALEVDGYTFHALRTRQALHEEGVILNHCVRTYADKVARGGSRIYSVRQGERRVATLELVRSARGSRGSQRFEYSQLKAHRNTHPDIAVSKATASFIAKANENLPAVQDTSPEDLARWQAVVGHGARSRAELCGRLGQEVYYSWFNNIEFDAFQDGLLQVSFPTRFLRNWVQAHYADVLLQCCAGEFPGLCEIEITLRPPVLRAPQFPVDRAEVRHPRQAAALAPAAIPNPAGANNGSPIDPRATFDSFVVGSSNRMAHAGAMAIAEAVGRGQRLPAYSSLVVHGGCGLGKSHLLHAIAGAASQRNPAAHVVYLTAARFTDQLVAGAAIPDDIDLLLIDDIDLLRHRSFAPQLDAITRDLLDRGRRVVMTCSQSPGQLSWLGAPLLQRLRGGLMLEIAPTDARLKRAVLEQGLEQRMAQDPTFHIAPELVARIADDPRLTDHRTIQGMLVRLHTSWQYLRTPITIEIVEHSLRELVIEVGPATIKIADILSAVALHFGVTRTDLLSQRRHPSVVWPRQVGMHLARRLTTRHTAEIGRRFGGRDSTTVLHAIRKVETRMAESAQIRAEIDALAERLSPGRDRQDPALPSRAA